MTPHGTQKLGGPFLIKKKLGGPRAGTHSQENLTTKTVSDWQELTRLPQLVERGADGILGRHYRTHKLLVKQ